MVAEARALFTWDWSNFSAALDKSADKIEGVNRNQLARFGASMATAFSIGALVRFGQQALRLGDEIDSLSSKLDITAQTTQSLQRISATTGIEFGQFEGAISKTRVAVERANTGHSKSIELFNSLGVSMDALRRMNTEQAFEAIARAMANNKGNSDVLNAAYEILGTGSGPQLTRALEELGEEGFSALNKRMLESNHILSNEAVAALDRAEQKIEVFSSQLRTKLVTAFAEGITATESLSEMIGASFPESVSRGFSVVAGEWTKVFPTLLEFAASGFSSAAMDLSRQQDELKEQFKRDTEEMRQAAAYAAAEREAQAKREAALIGMLGEYHAILKQEEEARVPLTERRKQITDELYLIEQHLLHSGEETIENAENLLHWKNRQRELNEDLLKLERELEKETKERERIEQNIARAKEDLRNAHEAWVMDGLNGLDKLRKREELLWEKLFEIGKKRMNLDETAANYQEQLIRLKAEELRVTTELNQVEREINKTLEYQVEKVDDIVQEWKELNAAEVRLLVDLRDALRDMNEKDIDEFLDSVNRLARGLRDISKNPPNVAWLQDLVNLRDIVKAPQALNVGPYINAIRRMAKELSGLDAPDLSWMATLGKISDIKPAPPLTIQLYIRQVRALAGESLPGLPGLPKQGPDLAWLSDLVDLSKIIKPVADQAINSYVNALKSIANALNANVDASWLKDVQEFEFPEISDADAQKIVQVFTGLADALSDMDAGILQDLKGVFDSMPSGDVTITLKAPSEDELTLKLPTDLTDNLPSIAKSLETLAAMKGVAWH